MICINLLHFEHTLRGAESEVLGRSGICAGGCCVVSGQLHVVHWSVRMRSSSVVVRGWLMSLCDVPDPELKPRVLERKWTSFGFASDSVVSPAVIRNWRRRVPAVMFPLPALIWWKVPSAM